MNGAQGGYRPVWLGAGMMAGFLDCQLLMDCCCLFQLIPRNKWRQMHYTPREEGALNQMPMEFARSVVLGFFNEYEHVLWQSNN